MIRIHRRVLMLSAAALGLMSVVSTHAVAQTPALGIGNAEGMFVDGNDRQRSYGGLNDDRQRSYGGMYDRQQSYGGLYDPDYARDKLKKTFDEVWGSGSPEQK